MTPSSETVLYLSRKQWEQMQIHVSQGAPLEICGLVAGVVEQNNYYAKSVIPITNSLHSTTRYRMDPKEQLEAFNHIEDLGQVLLAIYHAHPQGPAIPSATDIEEAYYPECVYLIWSGQTDGWICRGYFIQAGKTEEVKINIIGST